MKRMLVMCTVLVFLVCSVALGAAVNGTKRGDTLYGTPRGDQITGYQGNDYLYGKAGFDTINGGQGNDFCDGGRETKKQHQARPNARDVYTGCETIVH